MFYVFDRSLDNFVLHKTVEDICCKLLWQLAELLATASIMFLLQSDIT